MKMEFLVKGIVERTVSVEGNCIRDGIANAKKEWSALTGGELTTAETAYEELENGDKKMPDDVGILLDFVLDYGSEGLLPNMDEGGSGDIAYEAALRLKEVTPDETKQGILTALTKLYYTCVNNGWSRMADAISTAEDVARQEVDHD